MEDKNVIDPAINRFFTERKEAWVKKNVKASMSESELIEKKQECESIFKLGNWLPDAAKRAGQISISTHPCTFSHPSARKNKNGYVTSIIAENSPKKDGFLRSGNLNVPSDALGNAAALDVYKFLTLVMQDGLNLLEHIEQDTSIAQALLNQPNCDYYELRSGFLKMIESDKEVITSSKIKQVYFPVDFDEYHLLSILTNSGHLFEQRKRIDALRFGEDIKVARECKKSNKYHANGYREIFNLTTIGFGGTKPQNISVLNNQNAGKAHLLASIPPELKPRNVHIPKTDFFKDSIKPWHFKEVIESLHRILKTEHNNKNIRHGRDFRIQEYVDLIIQKMWQVRLFLNDYDGHLPTELKLEQKIWLYPEYESFRLNETDWLDSIVREISQSLIRHYKKLITHSFSLADEELLAIERIVKDNKEALR